MIRSGPPWACAHELPHGRWLRDAAAAVARHPSLWPTALAQLFVLARPGWWKQWPPLPEPDADYLRFRLVTAYGDPDRRPEPQDVVAYLKWCRRMRALTR